MKTDQSGNDAFRFPWKKRPCVGNTPGMMCFLVSFFLVGPICGQIDFAKQIKPVLAENCFVCHGADEGSREAGLRLDLRESAVEAGGIVPREPAESEVVARIFSESADVVMPPPESHKKLSAVEKELIRKWIEEGATYTRHWAYERPRKPSLPDVSDPTWPKNEIDYFVLAKLDTLGLKPSTAAKPRPLFRRLHLDITGLPPSITDTEQFVSDFSVNADEAVSQWVDRLMDTPAWGEHRARYWLDAARYADTHGMHFDNYREMWPYRDWVIRAFQQNKPFDEFVIEQLAGDLLPSPSIDQLVATGFQRCNMTTNEGGTIDEENLAIYAADRVQTFGWVFLGLTTNCCQCHDHKYDPLTMKDYYSLAAFFRNTTQRAKDGNRKDGLGPVIKVPTEEQNRELERLANSLVLDRAALSERRKTMDKEFDAWLAKVEVEGLGKSVSDDKLVVHAPLDQGKGHKLSLLAGEQTLVQPPSESQWVEQGKLGPAPIIKTGNTINLGSQPDFDFDQAFSYGCWVRATNQNGAAVIAKMDVSASHRGWDLMLQGGKVAAHLIDSWPGNSMKVTTEKSVLKPNQWQHLFVTYDGSRTPAGIKIYVDGESIRTRVENNTLKKGANLKSKTPLRIGQRSAGSVFENGSVQDVRIYARELPPEEVGLIRTDFVGRYVSIPSSERTEEQKLKLRNYFLTNIDEEYQAISRRISEAEAAQRRIDGQIGITHIQREKPSYPPMTHVLERGAYDKKGEQVEAATPRALHPLPQGAPRNRLGLAHWVVAPENPLTTRVTVNRFWQQVFGTGLVATSEDFGVMGTPPANQELLDWLAVDFRENDWDVQRIFRKLLTSAAYRQATIVTETKLAVDEENRFLSRGPRFRMDAEMIRDGVLSVSGLLSRKMYGPGVKPQQPDNLWNVVGLPEGNTRVYRMDSGEDLYRRSVYSFWKRMSPPPNLEAFDAPSREVCTVRRERTNTPLQALVTLNDPQFFEAARVLAERVLSSDVDEEKRLLDLGATVLSRRWTQEELAILKRDLEFYLEAFRNEPEQATELVKVGNAPQQSKLDAVYVAAWTMLCNQVLNLDEVLNK